MVYANLQNKITFPKKLDLKWTGIRINFENISIAEAEKVRKLANPNGKSYFSVAKLGLQERADS